MENINFIMSLYNKLKNQKIRRERNNIKKKIILITLLLLL